MSGQPATFRGALFLSLKFLILAPICMVAWWMLVPCYGYVLGQITGNILLHVLREPIVAVRVEAAGLLNTESLLVWIFEDGSGRNVPICRLITNMAPFVALVLATGGLGVMRRLKALAIGCSIIALGHIVFIIFTFQAQSRYPALVSSLSYVLHTLPFLLWVILAYWDKLMALMAKEDS